MKTCTLCQEEVTAVQLREGQALSRGLEIYHRECHRSLRGAPMTAPIPNRSRGNSSSGGPSGGFPPDFGASLTSRPMELAGFWRRFGAHVIDGFIMNVVVFFSAFIFGLGAGVTGAVEPTAISVIGGLIGALLPLFYCVWFWAKKGATPGKMMLGIRVVGHDNQPPTGIAAVVRYIGYIPSAMVFCLGFLWMIWEPENRCWHDMMAGTRVVRV